jgi:hypothetical protein
LRSPSSIAEQENKTYDPSQHSVVGTLTGTFFWRGLIEDILPPNTQGIVIVFENPCNPTFTYQVNGPRVEYLGRGDHHDYHYDDYRITSDFFHLDSFAVGTSMYSGPPLDREFCPFSVHVYPSYDFYVEYSTNDPIYFMAGAILIFVFTSAVFWLYDYTVQRRQRVVLNKAERSGAIVSSLFPAQVQEQLADAVIQKENVEDSSKNNKNKLLSSSGSTHIKATPRPSVKNYLEQGDDNNNNSTNNNSRIRIRSSPPIAELYENTTIFFADLVGFTQWSSTRTPGQVFFLLETIYGEWDIIAKRRRVFKVETIGGES